MSSDELSKFIGYRTYQRWVPELGRRETWEEAVNRLGCFYFSIAPKSMYEDIFEACTAIKNFEVMPSMRLLWSAGPAAEVNNLAAYNCSFQTMSSIESFADVMYVLMSGTGVGVSVEAEYSQGLPEVPDPTGLSAPLYSIDDSKKGWADSVKKLLRELYSGVEIEFDYSRIRPHGARLNTMGGRACLTGDTVVYKDRKKSREENEVTIKELYEIQQESEYRFSQIKLRSLDESTGVFYRNRLIKVIDNGIAEVYLMKTKGGYSIKATSNHRFMREDRTYRFLSDFRVGDRIAVNGEKLTGTCIDCNISVSRRAERCKSCFNVSQLRETASETSARQRKQCIEYRSNVCERTGCGGGPVYVHHIDSNPLNNNWSNLMNLCAVHHSQLHAAEDAYGDPYKQTYVTFDEIISIESVGMEQVYDLSMEAPNHNFVANGFVSHNSGYEPLAELHSFIKRIFKGAEGRRLKPIEISDIVNKMGQVVVVGGVRRSAIIVLFDKDDSEMLTSKQGRFWEENPQRSLSNISVAYRETPTHEEFQRHWAALQASGTGEPGFFFCEKNNSRNVVGTNPCVTGDTVISTLDGPKTFKELAECGKDVLVHAIDLVTRKPVVRMMRNPHMTKKNAQVLKITFDSGLVLRLTSNHKLITFRGGKVEAKNLSVGKSIRAFSLYEGRRKEDGYRSVTGWNRELNCSQETLEHRSVWECFNGEIPEGFVIHHKNGVQNDNRIENLELLSSYDHQSEHYTQRLQGGFYQPKISNEKLERLKVSYNHKIISIEEDGTADVYNGCVDDVHTYVILDPVALNSAILTGIYSANCGEILLRDRELCNLSEVVLRPDDNQYDVRRKVRIATLLGTLQATLTDFPYVHEDWGWNCREERLLGVSLTGIQDSQDVRYKDARTLAVITNNKYARRLGIPSSAAITCVKPSGTVSQLVNSSSGIHDRFSKYYIRRVRINAADPLAQVLRESGMPLKAEVGEDPKNPKTFVAEFYIESPTQPVKCSAINQLKRVFHVNTAWCDHNTSCTIYVEPEEWDKLGKFCWDNFRSMNGVSFLPKSDHLYELAPYEAITREQYEAHTPVKIDYSLLKKYEVMDNTSSPAGCESDTCEISFRKP